MSKKMLICLTLVFALAGVSSADLKVDIGSDDPSHQPVKAGWQEFTGPHEAGPITKDFDLDGTSISVSINIGNNDTAGYRNYGGGELGGDMVYPDDSDQRGPENGKVVLTLGRLPAGDYSILAYHNDSKTQGEESHEPHGAINVTVSGAVSASTEDLGINQTRNDNNDDNLAQSAVTFTAIGDGDVVITYAPVNNDGPDPRAVVNGFELTPTTPAGCACPGDQNDDGQIDLEDLQLVAGILLEAGTPFVVLVEPGHCADINADEQVDLEDLQLVAGILLQEGSPFVVLCD